MNCVKGKRKIYKKQIVHELTLILKESFRSRLFRLWNNVMIAVYVTVNVVRIYSRAPHNDVSVNDGPHIQRLSHNIVILYYNTYHCVTTAYSIQYSNMLYRFVA